ncbi:MAG: glycosyltransferase family 2 protein [Candidatus Sungbacteria bacterium]|uniref:Glycosyltransferase family 2 protein n=1 Tax=Candidatus Sungiibacteriota bacterium TaxID=2750080 RepID=A0A9D6LQ15_9BACT|nr:glycosyltransferase family 2 protein [Candidatus Sungbacteria bacterium]
MEEKWYLKAAHAPDFEKPGDYALFRFFEILPGVLMWATLAGTVLASYFFPIGASFFIIAFDIYWLLKTIFLSLHLRHSFNEMQKNLKINWREKLDALVPRQYAAELQVSDWREIKQLIIIPFYKEPYEVLKGGLDAIVKSNYPLENFFIVLAAEERAGQEAEADAIRAKNEFSKHFGSILVTKHPANLAGEIPGKGSNESYAAKTAIPELIDRNHIPYQHVLVSSFDVDTEVYPEYFGILTYSYITARKPLYSSFQPIPVYNNNVWDASAFSRVVATSGTFWQMMQQARPERLATFSSHSIPLSPLAEMNYWHTNMVSEDSRIFWQALMYYDGNYEVVPLYYPVSMDANLAPTTYETVKNVYRQQRRWIWGVENVPYLLFGFVKNKKIPFSKKLFFGFNQIEGFWSIGTNALMIFLLGWLPIVIGGHKFEVSVLAYNLPRITRYLMTLASIGMITSAIYSLKLLPPRPAHRSPRHYLWIALQWVLIPITLIVFGSIPGIDAETRLMLGRYMGFWVTPKVRLSRTETPATI